MFRGDPHRPIQESCGATRSLAPNAKGRMMADDPSPGWKGSMIISMTEAIDAEKAARGERIAAGRFLQVDETKIASPKDMMLLHRVRAAAAEGSATFDGMLGDRDVNRLFNDGALSFARPGQ